MQPDYFSFSSISRPSILLLQLINSPIAADLPPGVFVKSLAPKSRSTWAWRAFQNFSFLARHGPLLSPRPLGRPDSHDFRTKCSTTWCRLLSKACSHTCATRITPVTTLHIQMVGGGPMAEEKSRGRPDLDQNSGFWGKVVVRSVASATLNLLKLGSFGAQNRRRSLPQFAPCVQTGQQTGFPG